MEQALPLTEYGVLRGRVIWRQEGCYRIFSVDIPPWDNEVKKVWLLSPGGGRLLLGTLVPESGRLRLRRRLSLSALRCCGMTQPSGAEVNLSTAAPPEGWNSIRSLRLRDEALSAALAALPQGQWRSRNGAVDLRFPWSVGQPVPLVSLFCLAAPEDGWWTLTLPAALAERQG